MNILFWLDNNLDISEQSLPRDKFLVTHLVSHQNRNLYYFLKITKFKKYNIWLWGNWLVWNLDKIFLDCPYTEEGMGGNQGYNPHRSKTRLLQIIHSSKTLYTPLLSCNRKIILLYHFQVEPENFFFDKFAFIWVCKQLMRPFLDMV